MIAIDVIATPRDPNTASMDSFLEPSYQNIYNFLKSCVDQNLILNVVVVDQRGLLEENITQYFATTTQLAQEFEQVFSDMSAEFSIKKFWSQHDFDISISHHEIDFDMVDDTFELIGPRGEIWGQEF